MARLPSAPTGPTRKQLTAEPYYIVYLPAVVCFISTTQSTTVTDISTARKDCRNAAVPPSVMREAIG